MRTTTDQHPLFISHSIDELRACTGYSYFYLRDLREGRRPITDKFRRFVSAALQKPEGELFISTNGDVHD